MVKKAFAIFLSLIILSSLICACQTEQAQDDTPTKNTTNTTQTVPQWKTAYLNFLEQEKNEHLTYALVYIDNDYIPELYLSGNCEAVGDSVCTYKDGAVVEQQLNRIGGGWYIERSGNIINQNGNMGHINTHVYKLEGSTFQLTFQAALTERVEVLDDDNYVLHYEYSVAEESVSEDEYNAAVNAAFDFENAVRLNENEVGYDLIVQQIMEHN